MKKLRPKVRDISSYISNLSDLDIHEALISSYLVQLTQRRRRARQKTRARMITRGIPSLLLISKPVQESALFLETELSRNKGNIFRHLLVERN